MHPSLALFGVSVPTYPVMAALGVIVASFVWRQEALRARVRPAVVMDGVGLGSVFAAIGARAFHLLVERPDLALDPTAWLSPTLGWTFFGGLIGGVLGVTTMARFRGADVRAVLDVIVVGIPVVQALARLGCLAAGCCHGRPADLPWSIRYLHAGRVPDALLAVPVHPAPLYLSLLHVALFALLRAAPTRFRLGLFCTGYGAGRAALEGFRGDAGRAFVLGLSSAQWLGLALAAVGAWLIHRARTPAAPG